jgi:hypothetical protein
MTNESQIKIAALSQVLYRSITVMNIKHCNRLSVKLIREILTTSIGPKSFVHFLKLIFNFSLIDFKTIQRLIFHFQQV